MHTLQHFLNPAIRYEFWQGPAQVRTEADALQNGLNCVSLAHLVLEHLFGKTLPPELHCYEMFADQEQFSTIPPEGMRLGDLVWFGPRAPSTAPCSFIPQYIPGSSHLENWRESPVRHMAIHTGETVYDDPLMLHATPHEGTTAIWPLSQFEGYPRYAKICRIGRFVGNALQATAAQQQ